MKSADREGARRDEGAVSDVLELGFLAGAPPVLGRGVQAG